MLAVFENGTTNGTTLSGKRLRAVMVQKRKHVKKYRLTPQLAVNKTCVWFNGELLHTQNIYFDTIVYI